MLRKDEDIDLFEVQKKGSDEREIRVANLILN
jgi:hypothetical protein